MFKRKFTVVAQLHEKNNQEIIDYIDNSRGVYAQALRETFYVIKNRAVNLTEHRNLRRKLVAKQSKLNRMKQRLANIQYQIDTGHYKLCFGTKKLLNSDKETLLLNAILKCLLLVPKRKWLVINYCNSRFYQKSINLELNCVRISVVSKPLKINT